MFYFTLLRKLKKNFSRQYNVSYVFPETQNEQLKMSLVRKECYNVLGAYETLITDIQGKPKKSPTRKSRFLKNARIFLY